eukprot:COSAG01_NODE_855_length_13088_cov_13.421511_9_plen_182_part_00
MRAVHSPACCVQVARPSSLAVAAGTYSLVTPARFTPKSTIVTQHPAHLCNPPRPCPTAIQAAVWSAETAWWWQRTEDPAVGGTLDRPEVQGWHLTHHLHLRQVDVAGDHRAVGVVPALLVGQLPLAAAVAPQYFLTRNRRYIGKSQSKMAAKKDATAAAPWRSRSPRRRGSQTLHGSSQAC